MFNTLAILGVTALVAPIDVPVDLRLFDLLVMLAATVLLIVTAATNLRVQRWEGGLFLALYVVSTAVRASIAF